MPRKTGTYIVLGAPSEPVRAFVPRSLPPVEPPLDLSVLVDRLKTAEKALARLDVAGEMVPSLDWFIYAFVRKEAVVSSQIEGTQATLVDLLSWESQTEPAAPTADVEEVCNYVDGLAWARSELAHPRGLPLSMRLLNETHRRLMRGARGADKLPGEVRRSQNWIGGSRPGNAAYVPPPPEQLPELLGAFETYLNATDTMPVLLRAGLAHVQFETIHPYLDGNGRVGRLLVALMLESHHSLTRPSLYLSLFFKRHREEYYRRLTAVRIDGDWEGWLTFFLEGVATIADEAVASARELFTLNSVDRTKLLAIRGISIVALKLFELLPRNPIVSIAKVMRLVSSTKPSAGRAVDLLVEAGVLVEVTGRKRDRSFVYRRYLDVLSVGTELMGRR